MRVDATTVTVSSTVGCALQLHDDVLRGAGRHLHRCGRRSEARFQHGDFDCAWDGDDCCRTSRIGPVGCASDDYFRILDRLFRGTDLDAKCRRLILGCDCGSRKTGKNSERQHEQSHTHLRGCVHTHQSIVFLTCQRFGMRYERGG